MQYSPVVREMVEKHWERCEGRPVMVPDRVQQFISSAGGKVERGIVGLSMRMRRYFKKDEVNVLNPLNPEQYQQHDQVEQAPHPPSPSRLQLFGQKLNGALSKGGEVLGKVVKPILSKGKQWNDHLC